MAPLRRRIRPEGVLRWRIFLLPPPPTRCARLTFQKTPRCCHPSRTPSKMVPSALLAARGLHSPQRRNRRGHARPVVPRGKAKNMDPSHSELLVVGAQFLHRPGMASMAVRPELIRALPRSIPLPLAATMTHLLTMCDRCPHRILQFALKRKGTLRVPFSACRPSHRRQRRRYPPSPHQPSRSQSASARK